MPSPSKSSGKKPARKPKPKAKTKAPERKSYAAPVPDHNGEIRYGQPEVKPLYPNLVQSKYTKERADIVIHAISEGRTARAASILAGVYRDTLFDWKVAHPEFAARWEQALKAGGEFYKDEARRRATEGYLEPVFQQAMLVGHVRKFSDPLLIMHLKARYPEEFRERTEVENKGDQTITVKIVGGLPEGKKD